ncbi:MAG: Yip1 family protein [Undibacterium sp.]|nr:Yip1 family protein [Undibacterium sp.]
MNLIQRATNITLNPKTEWPVIAAETATTGDLFKSYIIPLSAIPAIASFIGMSVFGMNMPFVGHFRTPILTGLMTLILSFGLGLLSTYLISLIINALAPSFGGEKNAMQALKVTAYAFTPAWIAGVVNIIPSLGMLGVLAALYSIYVLYLGLPVLMKAPQEKAVAYTAVTVICSIVLMMIVMAVVGAVGGMSGMSGMHMRSGAPSAESSAAMGELAKMGEKMAEAGKRMEDAQKSGDTQAQMNAATEALGAALGGDSKVEVIDIAKLKALLPETVAGLKRTRFEGEKTAMGGFKISKAEAEYRDEGNREITLELTDIGGSKMFGVMFGWGMVESDKENDGGYEKMGKVDGRPTHEKFQKDGSSGEYGVLVGGRFMLEARGNNVDMASLKTAANSVGFARLEALKNEGVTK